jgi:hypothetical protein
MRKGGSKRERARRCSRAAGDGGALCCARARAAGKRARRCSRRGARSATLVSRSSPPRQRSQTAADAQRRWLEHTTRARPAQALTRTCACSRPPPPPCRHTLALSSTEPVTRVPSGAQAAVHTESSCAFSSFWRRESRIAPGDWMSSGLWFFFYAGRPGVASMLGRVIKIEFILLEMRTTLIYRQSAAHACFCAQQAKRRACTSRQLGSAISYLSRC